MRMFEKRVSFAGILFNVITNVIIFLVLKRDVTQYFQICNNVIINVIIF